MTKAMKEHKGTSVVVRKMSGIAAICKKSKSYVRLSQTGFLIAQQNLFRQGCSGNHIISWENHQMKAGDEWDPLQHKGLVQP